MSNREALSLTVYFLEVECLLMQSYLFMKKKIMNSCQDAISHLQSQCPNELLKCGSAAKCWQAELTPSG